jgi:hypothetical protein
MNELFNTIKNMAQKHAEIIEENIKTVLDNFKIPIEKVIINHRSDNSIEILISVAHFTIVNKFTYEGEDLIK